MAASAPGIELSAVHVTPHAATPSHTATPAAAAHAEEKGDAASKKKLAAAEYIAPEARMPFAEVAALYGTSVNVERPQTSAGLTKEAAAEALARYGPNILKPPHQVPEWLKFLKQFANLLVRARTHGALAAARARQRGAACL